MSRREKIILALMAIAILYGAYSFLGSSAEGPSPVQETGSLEALNAYVLGIAGSMSQLSLSDAEKYVMASAVTRWPEDPFLQTRAPEEQAAAEIEETIPVEDLNVSYTGYVEMNGRKLAIINGREYAPGEALEISGYVVRSIDPAKVELGKPGSGETVSLLIEEMFTRQGSTPPAGKLR
jgi:hypothetical protein